MQARIFRMAPEYRRCGIYVVVGFAMMAGVLYWLGGYLENHSAYTLMVCSFYGVISIFGLVPLHWAIRVDDCGIARRTLIGWDLWSWSDFASGRITKRPGFVLVDPARPYWLQELNLDYVAEPKELMRLVNQHYRMPDPPALPETLKIAYAFRRRLELHHDQIRLTISGVTHYYEWICVAALRITRLDPLRRDFVRVMLSLPGEEIELRHREYENPSDAELTEFLTAHVPSDRVEINIEGDSAPRKEDVSRLLDEEKAEMRSLRICLGSCAVLGTSTLIWAGIEEGVKPWWLTVVFAIIMIPGYFLIRREHRKRVARYEATLAALPNQEGSPKQHDPTPIK